MDLAEYLLEIAYNYVRHEGLNTPTQQLLKDAGKHLAEHAKLGILIKGSGGKGMPTHTPWIGFFNPDETESPENGVYVVYLFAENLESVALTLNQGITRLTNELGVASARRRLAVDAQNIRSHMPTEVIEDLDRAINLGSSGFRQRAYEAGNIVSATYVIDSLPVETTLRADLDRFLRLYEVAIETKRGLLTARPGSISTGSGGLLSDVTSDPLRDFKPKDDSDYVTQLSGRALIKSRRHETLVRHFGEAVTSYGWRPTTEHPIDLVLRRNGRTCLVEAKVIRGGNATEAVRSALGQLYAYRHFLGKPHHTLLALFSEDIGTAYADFLEQCGIASIWWDGNGWRGTPKGVELGACEPVRPGSGP